MGQSFYECSSCNEEYNIPPVNQNCLRCDAAGTVHSIKALRYNDGKPDWSLVDFHSLLPMVRVLEYGAKKYTVGEVSGRENWKKPMEKKQILNSAMRHLIKLMEGMETDEESGLPEIGHLMANLMFYSYHSRASR